MKKLALIACVLLAGCATLPASAPTLDEQAMIATAIAAAPKADRAEILVAVTMEVGARFRCPATQLEAQVLFAARISFDAFLRTRLQPESGAIVDGLRRATNAACGFVPVPPPRPNPEPAPAPPQS